MSSETSIFDLPDAIVMEIVARFPLKMVLACKCVSKSWYRVLSDPSFARLHLALSPPNSNVLIFRRSNSPKKACIMSIEEDIYDPHQYHQEQFRFSRGKQGNTTVIFGSCHGLLLIGYKSGTDLCVYNPIVRTKIYLPSMGNELEEYEHRRTKKMGKEKEEDITFCGIGYSHISGRYKVIKMRKSQAKVCVLGGDSEGHITWRDVDDKPPLEGSTALSLHNPSGVFIRGALYWFRYQLDQHEAEKREKKHITWIGFIFCFDIETERFHQIPFPPKPGPGYEISYRTFRLVSWNGLVAASYSSHRSGGVTQWSMWVMKEYESWSYEFGFELGGSEWDIYHLGTLSNGEVILGCLFQPHFSTPLCGLGPYTYNRGSKFRITTPLKDCFVEYAYAPSCLSPKEL